MPMEQSDGLWEFLGKMMPLLDERQRRLFLGSFSEYLGHGGGKLVSEITGVTPQTISAGRKESKSLCIDPTAKSVSVSGRSIRLPGGGRKRLSEKYPDLIANLFDILDGSLDDVVIWSTHTAEGLSIQLQERGFDISHDSVRNLLLELGFRLRRGRKGTGPDAEQLSYMVRKMGVLSKRSVPILYVETSTSHIGEKTVAHFTVVSVESWLSTYIEESQTENNELMIVVNSIYSIADAHWKDEFDRFVKGSNIVLHISQCPSVMIRWGSLKHGRDYVIKPIGDDSQQLLRVSVSLISMDGSKSEVDSDYGELDVETGNWIERHNLTFGDH